MIETLRTAIEVLLLTVVIYVFIRFLQETRGSGILRGFVVFVALAAAVFVLLVETLDLQRLQWLADRGLTLFVFALVVIFQPELRQAFVRLGHNPLLRTLSRSELDVAAEICQAVERLATRRIGAIIVIERREAIAGFTEGGTTVDAVVSAPLLVSIFWPNSPLHDGAVIVRQDRIAAAACLLPLTEKTTIAAHYGTRHRAAIGATEESDASVVVVSEETGLISLAERGQLRPVASAEELRQLLGRGLAGEEAGRSPKSP